jgi:L-fucose isomerase-like protein
MDHGGLSSIPENDIGGAVTQLIIRYLTGQVGAYFEFYEFLDHERLLIGVPDYVPAEVVEGQVHVVPWPGFGGLRGGLLNVSRVREGTVTLCRLGTGGDKFQLHVVVGDATSPRPWEEAGWDAPAPQLPSLEVELKNTTVDDFAQHVLGQHYILAYGDHRETLSVFCRFAGIEAV